MSTLQEFLKQRADHLRASSPERVRIQNEWIEAVDKLLKQIKQWLKDADLESILQVFEESVDRRESGVGVYTVHSLRIRLESQEVQVVPIARNVVGPVLTYDAIHTEKSFGRVDMTNNATKFLLFRTQREPEDQWVIVNDENYLALRLDRNSFDQAMRSLLE
jgi:hypothetical protein